MKKLKSSKLLKVNSIYRRESFFRLGVSTPNGLTYAYINEEIMLDDINPGDLIKINGYLKNDKYHIRNVVKINNPSLSNYLLVRPIPYSIKNQYLDFSKILASLQNEYLLKLMIEFVKNNKLFDKFLEYPCSVKSHDSKKHGLFYHTYKLVKQIENLNEVGKKTKDICIVGAVFHDLGKIKTLQNYFEKKGLYSYDFIIGHKQNSIEIFSDLANKIDHFPSVYNRLIKNIILGTHSTDFDKPITLQSGIISYLDKTDAAISSLIEENNKLSVGRFTKLPYQNNFFYKVV